MRLVLKADLNVDLLRYHQSIFNLDAKVSHGAFQLGVAEQELDRADVARAPVDQRRLSSAQGMRPVSRWIQPDRCDPAID